ncbi:transcription antitermination factor NusB [Deinococcus sp.]|uniref:transcription antitermination factor NusB n=1 Tax=Deinococcus sp. TaxID=47478 RepID=UPI003C7C4F60
MTRRREKAVQPVGHRRAAREFAFRVIFEASQSDVTLALARSRAEGLMRGGDDTHAILSEGALAFAGELLDAFQAHGNEVDDLLRRTIRGWSFETLAQTDLNVMRLAVLEMVWLDTPHPPVIESAVRTARKYGGDDSGKFVNGVLAGLSRSAERQSPVPSGEAPL